MIASLLLSHPISVLLTLTGLVWVGISLAGAWLDPNPSRLPGRPPWWVTRFWQGVGLLVLANIPRLLGV